MGWRNSLTLQGNCEPFGTSPISPLLHQLVESTVQLNQQPSLLSSVLEPGSSVDTPDDSLLSQLPTRNGAKPEAFRPFNEEQ
ncbi:hypothetical protein C7B61_18045, partial [filamentous cyanobacterium CCP1]